jgi:hypothetical protein
VTSLSAAGDAAADVVDELDHQLPSAAAVRLSVGSDHALVDTACRLDLDLRVAGEPGVEALALSGGEQVGAGVQGAAGPVERIGGQTEVALEVLLDPVAAAVERVACETDDVEGVHHRDLSDLRRLASSAAARVTQDEVDARFAELGKLINRIRNVPGSGRNQLLYVRRHIRIEAQRIDGATGVVPSSYDSVAVSPVARPRS